MGSPWGYLCGPWSAQHLYEASGHPFTLLCHWSHVSSSCGSCLCAFLSPFPPHAHDPWKGSLLHETFSFYFPTHLLGSTGGEQHSFWIYLLCLLSQVVLSCSGLVSTGWGLGLRWWFSTWPETWLPFLILAPSPQTYQGPFIHCCDLDPMQPSSPLETSLQLRTSILDMVDLISCSSSSPIN